jgi:hypothetical protein
MHHEKTQTGHELVLLLHVHQPPVVTGFSTFPRSHNASAAILITAAFFPVLCPLITIL